MRESEVLNISRDRCFLFSLGWMNPSLRSFIFLIHYYFLKGYSFSLTKMLTIPVLLLPSMSFGLVFFLFLSFCLRKIDVDECRYFHNNNDDEGDDDNDRNEEKRGRGFHLHQLLLLLLGDSLTLSFFDSSHRYLNHSLKFPTHTRDNELSYIYTLYSSNYSSILPCIGTKPYD